MIYFSENQRRSDLLHFRLDGTFRCNSYDNQAFPSILERTICVFRALACHFCMHHEYWWDKSLRGPWLVYKLVPQSKSWKIWLPPPFASEWIYVWCFYVDTWTPGISLLVPKEISIASESFQVVFICHNYYNIWFLLYYLVFFCCQWRRHWSNRYEEKTYYTYCFRKDKVTGVGSQPVSTRIKYLVRLIDTRLSL